MVIFRLACLSLLFGGPLHAGALPKIGDFELRDVDGLQRSQAEWREHAAVVLLFIDAECPVSNSYAPEMQRIAARGAEDDVLVLGVHSDPDVTAAAGKAHAREYGLAFPLLLDPDQQLATQAGVRVVLTAVVLSSNGQVLYRGRVDDRYTPQGKRRVQATTHELRDAIAAALHGRPPAITEAPAFGCPLPKLRRNARDSKSSEP
jgi:peroxiredoxin